MASSLWNVDGASRELVSSPNLGSPIRSCKNEGRVSAIRLCNMSTVQSCDDSVLKESCNMSTDQSCDDSVLNDFDSNTVMTSLDDCIEIC